MRVKAANLFVRCFLFLNSRPKQDGYDDLPIAANSLLLPPIRRHKSRITSFNPNIFKFSL